MAAETVLTAMVAVERTAFYFDRLFSYEIPAEMAAFVSRGVRVLVPCGRGNRLSQGMVFSAEEAPRTPGLKAVAAALDREPLLSEELLNLAKQIAAAQKEGDQLGLTADELAFYDALTKPQAIKDFYENEELIAITKELADTLRKNRTIDWQKRDSARAKMRMMIKKLLRKHRYPPEGMDDAVQTVMTQCELWTDNTDMVS